MSSLMAIGMLVTLLLGYSSLFPAMEKRFQNSYQNIRLVVFDASIRKVNPSVLVIVDNDTIVRANSISEVNRDMMEMNLSQGIHKVSVSNLDGKYTTTQNFEIEHFGVHHRLKIKFISNPPIEEYIDSLSNRFWDMSSKRKALSGVERDTLYAAFRNLVAADVNQSEYQPGRAQFEIEFDEWFKCGIE